MTDQSYVSDLSKTIIDLFHQLVGITGWDQIGSKNDFIFCQVEFLRQDFRCLSRSKVRAG